MMIIKSSFKAKTKVVNFSIGITEQQFQQNTNILNKTKTANRMKNQN